MERDLMTYYTKKGKFFALSAGFLMLLSIAFRTAALSIPFLQNPGLYLVNFLVPVLAGLMFSIRFIVRGEKQLYKTVTPIQWLSFYGFGRIIFSPLSFPLTALFLLIVATVLFLYVRTFRGKQKSHFPLLAMLTFIATGIAFIPDGKFFFFYEFDFVRAADFLLILSLVTAMLAVKKLPPAAAGEPYRLRYGDRIDGRRVRGIDPMAKLSPYFMPNRNGANILLKDKIDTTVMEDFIHQKRREGYKRFGTTHVLLASYARTVAELPGLNRFISGQRIYTRFKIVVNMVVKKELNKESPDTVIKIILDPRDTAIEVYRKFEEKLDEIYTPTLDSNFDKLAEKFDYIPGLLLKFVIWLLKCMDYFGNLPAAATDLSPFHGSLFITSMGSLGIPPVYHHLYDFGNVPIFCAFGFRQTSTEILEDGEIRKRKYLDYSFVSDERIVDGFYYAAALKKMRSYMSNPERLDVAPLEIVEDIL